VDTDKTNGRGAPEMGGKIRAIILITGEMLACNMLEKRLLGKDVSNL
jgi:hypothetical protein